MDVRFVGILVGGWYVAAPAIWGYGPVFNWWHSLALGGAVLALSAAALVRWNRLVPWLLVVVGAYSMVSPFLYGYLPHSRPFFNDLFFGVALVAVGAVLGAASTEVLREQPSARPRWHRP